MNNKEFVKLVRDVVRQSSIDTAEKKLTRGAWFRRLSKQSQLNVRKSITDAVDASLFGMLCLIEGTTVDDDANPLAMVELFWDDGTSRFWLNDPDGTGLHDHYFG